MAIRNFYIDAEIEGRKTPLCGGLARKDGGMEIVLTQRENGDIMRAFTISCTVDGNDLETCIKDRYGRVVYIEHTLR